MLESVKRNKDVLIVLALVVFAWVGVVDQYAEQYINGSLVSAGASFGIARLFNATVSVLSTITLNVPIVGSVQIGQLLDPLNDLVEDFSSVMKYAISSLLIQKFLVEILQTLHFKVFLSLSGVMYLATKFVWTSHRVLAYKVFLFAVICKFSIAMVAVASSWVDEAFLDEAVQKEYATLEAFPASPDKLDQALDLSQEIKAQVATELEAEQAKQQLLVQQRQRLTLEESDQLAQIDRVEEALVTAAEGRSGFSGLFEKTTQERALERQRNRLLAQLRRIQGDLDRVERDLDDVEDDMSDLQDRLEGKVSTFASIRDGFSRMTMAAKDKVTGYVDTLNQSIDHFLNLIALFVLKTIIIPLLFLVIMYKVFVRLWGMTPRSAVAKAHQAVKETRE
ncbi:hypothetical protein ACFQ45_13350 [Rhodanobacter aciditrophus]|uniref:DUF4349 domain-containing protein n=1 Tax=Rhodanobacter aciditrophus TaxID=1623218 RepID=A0ABW4B3I1_9GAMM